MPCTILAGHLYLIVGSSCRERALLDVRYFSVCVCGRCRSRYATEQIVAYSCERSKGRLLGTEDACMRVRVLLRGCGHACLHGSFQAVEGVVQGWYGADHMPLVGAILYAPTHPRTQDTELDPWPLCTGALFSNSGGDAGEVLRGDRSSRRRSGPHTHRPTHAPTHPHSPAFPQNTHLRTHPDTYANLTHPSAHEHFAHTHTSPRSETQVKLQGVSGSSRQLSRCIWQRLPLRVQARTGSCGSNSGLSLMLPSASATPLSCQSLVSSSPSPSPLPSPFPSLPPSPSRHSCVGHGG